MSRGRLLWNLVGFSSFFGLVAGAALGILYYLIIFQFSISIDIFYFALLGGICGTLLGGFNGVLFFLITWFFVGHKIKLKSYKVIMLLGAIILTVVVGYVLFSALISIYAVIPTAESRILPIIVATGLAAIAAGFLSQYTILWSLKLTAPQST